MPDYIFRISGQSEFHWLPGLPLSLLCGSTAFLIQFFVFVHFDSPLMSFGIAPMIPNLAQSKARGLLLHPAAA